MKTAVIGTGRMGCRHIQVAQDLGLDLVGICDISSESLLRAAKEFSLPELCCYSNPEELLAQSCPECLIIATTAPTHCTLTCKAAEAGVKFILCEKPMAVSLEECNRMIETCRCHGASLSINHQMRFMEQYTAAREIVTSDAFGGLASVMVSAGNFGLAMNGTHYFEMFRYITGEAPVAAAAWLSDDTVPNPRGPQFLDHAGCVRLETATGKRFYMDAGSDQGHGMGVVYTGKFGRLTVDELAGEMSWCVRNDDQRELPTTRYGCPWSNHTRSIEPADAVAPTRAVLHALLEGRDVVTGEDGRLAVAALVAAHCSNEKNHCPVAIDQTLSTEKTFPWA